MRFILFIILLASWASNTSAQTYTPQQLAFLVDDEPARTRFTPEELSLVRSRLASMTSIIGKHDHPVIESYIQSYMLRQRQKSSIILGRVPTYFPLFEEELRKAGLPDDLKYLAIVESALDPTARSRSGAGGLWQFMPGTAAMFSLTVNNTIDERSDVFLSTQAAIAFLRDEYERFGDWALVLAAYNGGPGRVRRAIRRSGKKSFWEIRNFLPRETRNYVPAFVAAMYLHKYGAYHAVSPTVPSLDEQLVSAVACPYGVSLHEVAQATELSLDVVKHLNSHCRGDYVPAGPTASVRVPTRTATSLKTYLSWRVDGSAPDLVTAVRARPVVSGSFPNSDHLYKSSATHLPAKTTLSQAAASAGVSEHHLKMWNPHLANYSNDAQSFTLYAPRFVPNSPMASRPKLSLAALPTSDISPLALAPSEPVMRIDHALPNTQVVLQRYQSLLEVWQPFANDTSWAQFLAWNHLKAGKRVKPGTVLYVRDLHEQ